MNIFNLKCKHYTFRKEACSRISPNSSNDLESDTGTIAKVLDTGPPGGA